ncbi:MAG: transcription termination/antitermination NusG family protein [Verrucomicrobiota bacterium]
MTALTSGVDRQWSVDPGQWYCAYTKPKQEDFARLHLERQGMQAFLPLLKSQRVKRHLGKWTVVPLFPRYLFVKPGDVESLMRVRSTLGVACIVSFGGKPSPVPPEIIQTVRDRCADGYVVLDEPAFRKGDKVCIVDGPYQGMNAIFDQETTQEQRVVILLEIMASVARVTIDRRLLVHEAAAV